MAAVADARQRPDCLAQHRLGRGCVAGLEEEPPVVDLRCGGAGDVADVGVEAEQLVRQYPLDIDLLLVDVDLPPTGGLWLAARFLARWPGMEILYSFREVQDDPVGRGLLPPETPLLFKPYGLIGISDVVREMLNGTESSTFDRLGV